MRRHHRRPALCLLAALLLAACAPGNVAPILAPPTAMPSTAAPSSSPASTAPAVAATAIDPAAPLAGPLLGIYIEDSYEDHYFAVFDASTGAFRQFNALLISPGEAQWFADGCRVFAHGQLLDLRGQARWTLPPEAAALMGDAHNAQLSPGLSWLVYPVAADDRAAGGFHVEVVGLTAPFAHTRLTERGGGSATALLWPPDEAWLYFSDFDTVGRRQLYRARPDGGAKEQLTDLDEAVAQFNALALSPDGRRLAYGARNLLAPSSPYAYDPADEGWIGILDLDSGANIQARLPKFGAAENGRGLVWDAAGERLLVVGDSLPITHDDPLAGRQAHWLTAGGEIVRSFYQAEGPSGQVGWIAPLGDIDRLMFSSNADYYVLENGAARRLEGASAPALGTEIGRRPIGVLPGALGFPGEAACAQT